MFYNIYVIQSLTFIAEKNFKKSVWNVWCVLRKPLLLHPLSRRKASPQNKRTSSLLRSAQPFFRKRKVLHLRNGSGEWLTDWSEEKTFFEKSSENIWSVFKKVLIFASAFATNGSDSQEWDLWKNYITRQSSTRAKSPRWFRVKTVNLLIINR